MSEVLSRGLRAPRRWQELESLAFDVYRRQWKTSDAQLNGRAGQPQAGVDVYGTDRVEGRFTGVQCNGKDGDYGGALTETVDPAGLPFDGLLLHAQAVIRLGDPARSASLVERLAERGADEPAISERGQLIDALRVRAAILTGANRTDVMKPAIAAAPQSRRAPRFIRLLSRYPPED